MRFRRRRHQAGAKRSAEATTAAVRELLGLKADVQQAMERVAEADRAIDRWKEHRGTSPA